MMIEEIKEKKSLVAYLREKYFKKPKMVNMKPAVEQAFSIAEMAESLGTFPTDVERLVKKMLKQGMVKVYWYEDPKTGIKQMYVSLVDIDMETIKRENEDLSYIA